MESCFDAMTSARASRLQYLAGFRAVLDATSNLGLEKSADLEVENGFYVIATPPQSPTESEFEEMAYQHGWVLEEFDWLQWIKTERGASLIQELRAVAEASEDELAQVITCLVRSRRFGDNLLLRALESGFVSALASRAQELLAAHQGGSEFV